MSKIKSLCGKCSNNCKEGFTIFANDESAKKLTQKFSFFQIVRSGIDIVGKTKRTYHVIKCDKLKADGSCDSYPENAPAWCQVKS